MPIPINPALLSRGAKALGQAARQVVKSAPDLAEKAGASRLASKAMSGLGGLSERLPSKLPSAATLQQGVAGLRPRLQNASLLGKMGGWKEQMAQVSQLVQMLPVGHSTPTGPAGPAEPAESNQHDGPAKPGAPAGHIRLGQFAELRDTAYTALKGPMASALRQSERATQVVNGFLQALHDVESHKLYQNFAPALVNQMFGEAEAGLRTIDDLIQRFHDGVGKLDTALQPPPTSTTPQASQAPYTPQTSQTPPTGTTPRPQPPKLPPRTNASSAASSSASSSTASSASSSLYASAQSTPPPTSTTDPTPPTETKP